MSDDVKRRRRWRVTLWNPIAYRRSVDERGSVSLLYLSSLEQCEGEGASMGRAFHRALEAGGAGFLAQPAEADDMIPARPGYDFCGAAVHAFEMAREAMMRRSAPAYRVTVTIRGFSVEIERIR